MLEVKVPTVTVSYDQTIFIPSKGVVGGTDQLNAVTDTFENSLKQFFAPDARCVIFENIDFVHDIRGIYHLRSSVPVSFSADLLVDGNHYCNIKLTFIGRCDVRVTLVGDDTEEHMDVSDLGFEDSGLSALLWRIVPRTVKLSLPPISTQSQLVSRWLPDSNETEDSASDDNIRDIHTFARGVWYVIEHNRMTLDQKAKYLFAALQENFNSDIEVLRNVAITTVSAISK